MARKAAGWAAGLFAGGLATTLYGLHGPEATFLFVVLWYSLGMGLCGALGALVAEMVIHKAAIEDR